MAMTGVFGNMGAGKSLKLVDIALEQANRKRKGLCFNFPVNFMVLEQYCKLKKYRHCEKLFRSRVGVSVIQNPQKTVKGRTIPNLQALMIPGTVSCIDEAGIFMNSRSFASIPVELLAALCQQRKNSVDVVYTAQFPDQVDKQLRQLTHFYCYADGLTVYSKKHRRPNLVRKKYYWMYPHKFNIWDVSPFRDNALKTRFAFSFKYESGFLTKADKLLFDAFNSFGLLDSIFQGKDHVSTLHLCPLARVRCVTPYPTTHNPQPHTPTPTHPHTYPLRGSGGGRGGEKLKIA